jgi:hypothetical protein
MKKIILVLVMMGMVFSSCSKSDSEANINFSVFESYGGVWYIKEFIKEDGTKATYMGNCTNKRDYVEFFFPSEIGFFQYSSNCSDLPSDDYCRDYYIADLRIYYCMEMINGTISKSSNGIIQIDYEESRNLLGLGGVTGRVKGIVLERQE